MGIARRLLALAAVALLPGLHGAQADEADFYAGKSLTIIAGLPPGGGVDGEMRVLARYFSKYIPGHPTIVTKNMPGAGGVLLANSINRALPDGLTLAMPGRSGFLLSNVVPQKVVAYDLTKFSFVGSAGGAANALWVSAKTGVHTVAELKASKREIVIGALSQRSENAIAPRVLATYEHWPLKIVTGYPGFNEVLIAIERGEVEGLFSHEGSILNARPDMVESGLMKPLAQAYDYMPNVPLLDDVVGNADARALLGLVTTPSRIGLPLLGPPGVPPERLDILRKAYAQLMQDEEYRAEADKRGLPVGRAVSGADLQKFIAQNLSNVPERVVKAYMDYSGLKADE
jgi:tripartite-type tricarboxylate transporter receptor subunit TctC